MRQVYWGFTGADPCFSLLGRPWSAAAEGQHGARSSLGVCWGVTGADPCFNLLGRPWSAAAEGQHGARSSLGVCWGLLGPILVSVYWAGHGAQPQRGSMVRESHWGVTGGYWGRSLFQFNGEAMERNNNKNPTLQIKKYKICCSSGKP